MPHDNRSGNFADRVVDRYIDDVYDFPVSVWALIWIQQQLIIGAQYYLERVTYR